MKEKEKLFKHLDELLRNDIIFWYTGNGSDEYTVDNPLKVYKQKNGSDEYFTPNKDGSGKKYYENIQRDTKRKNQIEKTQLSILQIILGEISADYLEKGVYIDQSIIPDIKKHKHQWIITAEGKIEKADYPGKNEWYDSKSFDAIVPIMFSGGKEYTVFFILKGVEYSGGHQDDVKKEIGTYSKQIQKNKNDEYHFIFQLDGTYLNKNVEKLDKSDKYDVTTTKTLKETIENFILKNLA